MAAHVKYQGNTTKSKHLHIDKYIPARSSNKSTRIYIYIYSMIQKQPGKIALNLESDIVKRPPKHMDIT